MSDGPPLRYPLNALVSFHYYRTIDVGALAAGGLRLIGDSGAYSALNLGVKITVDQYAEWAHRWRHALAWIASLDVIGDAKGSDRNYQALRAAGLDVVPTIHAGADHRLLDAYAYAGVDFVGLGGLVPHRGRPLATLPWLVDVMRYARDNHPGMRFHGWGVTSPRLIKALPWYSVDSSSIGQGYRYARVALFDPSRARWVQIPLDGRAPFAHADLLGRHYNVRPRDIARSTPANRRVLVRLTGRSYQLVEDYLQRRHGTIAAPTYGAGSTGGGPAVHAVDGSVHNLQLLADGPNVHGVAKIANLRDLTDQETS